MAQGNATRRTRTQILVGPAEDQQVHPLDDNLRAEVHHELAAFLQAKRNDAAQIDQQFVAAVDSLSDFVLGPGKRLRPTFAWWGWRGAGGCPVDPQARAVLRAVSSLELIHACALVHDDLMDDSTTRRGAPTVHVNFAAQHCAAGWSGTPERFGAATAILLGDIALAWADDMLRGSDLWPDQLHRAHAVWQAMRTEVLAGQYLDVFTQASGDEAPETALQIDRYKTAAYTVERPLHLGAAIAGAGPGLVHAYRHFGADIGIAFQLRDDLLGMFGDPRVTGKPAGDDLREGKRTLLLAYGLRAADEKRHTGAADLLRGAIGNPQVDENTVTEIRELLIELGAVAEVERRITTLTDSALGSLCAADLANPAGARLTELAVQATCRVR
ncbi:MAG TPA: polyprenyl synthetase family protein [Pseudonocardiaceae bacterium]|jgi:geranylgeranyl diphosphate synthase type I|nr:polyprenyl synthetase family protein [Pseudonocardiaceae bacterium]